MSRYKERFAKPSLKRPDGVLIWIHVASVGELNSVIPLIQIMNNEYKFLITTITVTASKIIIKSNLNNTLHQYLPIDVPFIVENFLEHWSPNLGIFVESELWPNFIIQSAKKMPLILLNGDIDPNTFKIWNIFKSSFYSILSSFKLIMPSGITDLNQFKSLGLKNIKYIGNLKSASPPPAVQLQDFKKLSNILKGRKIILYSSTHDGEEEIAIRTHIKIKEVFPNLLTIIAPRHPERGKKISTLARNYGLSFITRSKCVLPISPLEMSEIDIYIADTLGELGLFYKITDIAFIGGSLIPHGGQNILEAAHLGCAILIGPYAFNFQEIVEVFINKKAIVLVENEERLVENISLLLRDKALCEKMKSRAQKIASHNNDIMKQTIHEIVHIINTKSDSY